MKDFGLPKPSPNPPKIDPKSNLEKTLDFSSVVVRCFPVFRSSISWKCAFYHSKTTNPKVFAKIVLFRFSSIFHPKNLPKTPPKRGPNPSKIDAENVLFFNIDFFGFRSRFWNLLGPQDGLLGALMVSSWRPERVPGASGGVPEASRERPKAPKPIFQRFSSDFGRFFLDFLLFVRSIFALVGCV